MSESEKNAKKYEMSYFLTAGIPEDKVDNAVKELDSLIAKSGGDNIVLEAPKRKRVSYPINKQNDAYFGTAYFNINAEGLDKIKKSLSFYKNVLRYMILINKPQKSKPAAIPAPVKSIDSESAPESIPQSFDQKLENILNR